jgi:death on curing protein
MIEPIFLTVDDVLDLHADQLAAYGGTTGVRDIQALDAAVETARKSVDRRFIHEDVFAMAAAYAFHIADSRSLLDGNNGAALNAALVFLLINGWLVPDPKGRLYDAMLAIAARTLDKPGLAKLFKELAVQDEAD